MTSSTGIETLKEVFESMGLEWSKWCIESLLDLDYYKLTMGQFWFKRYRDIEGKFAFKNRTLSVPLADQIDEAELREQMDHARTLRFSGEEIRYLEYLKHPSSGNSVFCQAYLNFLANYQLPEYSLTRVGNTYEITFEGKVSEITYWETICLSIVNELFYRSLVKTMSARAVKSMVEEGQRRLEKKINELNRVYALFTDFGTRRRFMRVWQKYVVRQMKRLGGRFMDTSNVRLAMELCLTPIGTYAHEMDMIMSGICWGSDDDIRQSHQRVMQEWWEMYGVDLSIALTDTYGSEFFFADMTDEQARNWKGLRHDSGDPIEFGERVIAFYKEKGIDPREKLIVFSDGLDCDTIIRLSEHFKGRINTAFGWGTNLTNDMSFQTLSLVVKAVESNGHGTVKLSDNLNKAIGPDEETIARFKQIFGHNHNDRQECKV